jgi:hypothetical protein
MLRTPRSFPSEAVDGAADGIDADEVAGHRGSLPTIVLIVILCASSGLYYAALAPERFGSYHDDSIYATTAKALATGQGYRIISLPSEPAQTKYPPFYPLLLSLIWRVHSQFSQNVLWMTLLSSVAALSFLALTYRYLTSHGYSTPLQALIVVGLAAINWRTIILASGMYSEMPFAALSVAGLHLAERDTSGKRTWMNGLLLGVLLGLVFLTRSSGLVLLVSVVAYFALRKNWRRGAVVLATGGLFVLGWVWWCYQNKTSDGGINTAYYTSYLGHLQQTIAGLQATSNSSALSVYLNIILTNFIGGILVSVPVVCSGLNYGWMSSPGSSVVTFLFLLLLLLVLVKCFVKHMASRIRLLHIYLLSSFAIYLLWLPGVAYDRFLMPLLPFLLVFLVRGFDQDFTAAKNDLKAGDTVRKFSGGVIVLTLLAALGLGLYSYGSGMYRYFAMTNASEVRAAEDSQAIAWLTEHADRSDTIACYRDPKYFLYTGNKAVRSFPMTEDYTWQEDEASMSKLAAGIFRVLDEANTRYLVVTSTDFELEDNPQLRRTILDRLIEEHPQKFALAFKSPDGRSRIYRTDTSSK